LEAGTGLGRALRDLWSHSISSNDHSACLTVAIWNKGEGLVG
jgi:hypothetical protein